MFEFTEKLEVKLFPFGGEDNIVKFELVTGGMLSNYMAFVLIIFKLHFLKLLVALRENV